MVEILQQFSVLSDLILKNKTTLLVLIVLIIFKTHFIRHV